LQLEASGNMKNFVSWAFAALLLSGLSAAQTPAVDVFGGYSYLNLQVPSSGVTDSQRLKLNGWNASASIGLFHHFSAEADLSGHQLSDCGGVSDLKCDDFSYMFGPRYTFGDRGSRVTVFLHGLVGQDRGDILDVSSTTVSDTSIAVAAGGGLDIWFLRHVGLQIGPADFLYMNHFHSDNASSQTDYRVAAGVAFRFGGNFPPAEPKAPKEPKEATEEKSEKSHRSWIRPWHKTKTETASAPSESEPTTSAPAAAPRHAQSAPPVATVPSRGMPIHSLGVVVAPQEFDGARILEIEPGSIAEMASLHVGDLIKSVDGKPVKTPMELAAEISDKTGKVRIGIQRGTFTTETEILLGAH
jgi:Outer membrane protein beta-barrel domain/PDZ domain